MWLNKSQNVSWINPVNLPIINPVQKIPYFHIQFCMFPPQASKRLCSLVSEHALHLSSSPHCLNDYSFYRAIYWDFILFQLNSFSFLINYNKTALDWTKLDQIRWVELAVLQQTRIKTAVYNSVFRAILNKTANMCILFFVRETNNSWFERLWFRESMNTSESIIEAQQIWYAVIFS